MMMGVGGSVIVGAMGVASVLVGIGVAVSVGVAVGVGVSVGVSVGVGVGVGVGSSSVSRVRASRETGSFSAVYGLFGPKTTTRSVMGPKR